MALTDIVRAASGEQAHRSEVRRKLNREQRTRVIAITWVWTLALVGLVLVFPGRTAAQGPPVFTPSANPVSDAVRTLLARESKNLVGSAELMPAEKYAFQPTPAQMTFGQLVAHIVQTNVFICSGLGSTPSPMTPDELKKRFTGFSGTSGRARKSFGSCADHRRCGESL